MVFWGDSSQLYFMLSISGGIGFVGTLFRLNNDLSRNGRLLDESANSSIFSPNKSTFSNNSKFSYFWPKVTENWSKMIFSKSWIPTMVQINEFLAKKIIFKMKPEIARYREKQLSFGQNFIHTYTYLIQKKKFYR